MYGHIRQSAEALEGIEKALRIIADALQQKVAEKE